MRKMAAGLVALALLAVLGRSADATNYGTLTIKQIQDPNTAPNPVALPNPAGSAVGDTVGPVCGIITAFDTFPTLFSFYLQNSQGGPWTGIDCFTGGVNTPASLGLAVGDSVCVTGALIEASTVSAPCAGAGVDGETEIVARNGSLGTDLVITKISSGNPLPPIHVGTVAELQELCTNPNAEQWEGGLVRVNGPLRICRTNATGGLGTTRAALVVSNTLCPPGHVGACDSMFIDLSTLANPQLSPGNVTLTVDYVQGVYNERTRGYRIQCRNLTDYGLEAPPALVREIAIADNTYRVIMDRDVTQATAENEANYTILSTLGNPSLATQVNPTTIDLTVNTGLSPGALDHVTVYSLTAVSSGLTMMSGQTSSFHVGILSPAQIQGPDIDSLAALCRDVAKYQTGGPVSMRAVCVARFGTTYYLEGSSSPRDGIGVSGPPAVLNTGTRYVLIGTPGEYFGETQMSSIVYVKDEGAAAIPSPVVGPIAVLKDVTCDSNHNLTTGEDNEDMLVRLQNVKCAENRSPGQSFFVTTVSPSTDTLLISNFDGGSFTFEADSNKVINVQGILHFTFATFRICPRGNADIEPLGVAAAPNGVPEHVSFSVFPNPGRSPRVRFSLPREDEVELGVYDLAGRRVAMLAQGRFPPGLYSRDWNGLNSKGEARGSGMYFYRLKFGAETRVVRAVKLE